MDRKSIVSAISEWLNENCNCTTIKTCDECANRKLKLYEKQIKAEVIDEFTDRIRALGTTPSESKVHIMDVLVIAKQMKE